MNGPTSAQRIVLLGKLGHFFQIQLRKKISNRAYPTETDDIKLFSDRRLRRKALDQIKGKWSERKGIVMGKSIFNRQKTKSVTS